MTVKQRIVLAVAAVVLVAAIFLLVWFLQRPEETPDGVLVYKEAYMRVADRPWQGECLCRNR